MKILIIEDEKAIAEVERAYIEKEGYSADIAENSAIGIEKFEEFDYDLVILDLMLPGMSGLEVCRFIRSKKNTPIIMVTAKSREDDIIAGLDAGADDYVIKPFSPKVLMARVRANLRKTGAEFSEGSEVIKIGPHLVIKPQNYAVYKDDIEIPMTKNEFLILSCMANRPEKTWSRDELITYALGDDYDGFERSVDSYIKNIRKKLHDPEHDFIKTVYGFGYKLTDGDK